METIDVRAGQRAVAALDLVGRHIESGIASALVGEQELELARLKRKTRGVQLRGDRVAEIGTFGTGDGGSGRHSVGSAVAARMTAALRSAG